VFHELGLLAKVVLLSIRYGPFSHKKPVRLLDPGPASTRSGVRGYNLVALLAVLAQTPPFNQSSSGAFAASPFRALTNQ
jgi:hypothetical protein